MNRLQILSLLALLLALCLAPNTAVSAPAAVSAAYSQDELDLPTEMPGYSAQNLRELADSVQRTGVGRDLIPALDRPAYLSMADADLSMDNNEPVFVIHYPNSLVRIYPQRILVWHEVVNDWVTEEETDASGVSERAGAGYTLSYSPLTGAVVAFKSMAGKYTTSFGTSGMLLNGNTVLYDRISRSLWVQLMAVSIEGPFRGKRLSRIPVIWTTWRGAKARYNGLNPQFSGKAEVLSRATGFHRTYGKDPYGNYQTPESYYDNNKIPFPVNFLDTRLPPKTRILGLEVDTAFGAVLIDVAKEKGVINFSLGMIPMVALYDQELGAVRVFERRLPGREGDLSFAVFENKLVDEQTRTEWRPSGVALHGPLRDKALTEVLSTHSMWFAWASFYQGSQIIPGQEW